MNLPCLQPLEGLAGNLLVVLALGLLDEAEHVAHPEDPAREAVRVEDLEVGDTLACGQEGDRPPTTCLTERAAPPRASPSTLVKMMPSSCRAWWNASAVWTAS